MASDDTQKDYPGLPLNLEDDFRLVEIEPGKLADVIWCSLFSTRVRDTPKYEALSYTWGSLGDKQSIQCKGPAGDPAGRLLITQNCAAVNVDSGRTWSGALAAASRGGHFDIVRRLVEAGANVNHGNRWLGSCRGPLKAAEGNGNRRIIQLLLDHGARREQDCK
jgi:hypothetical protein